MSLLGFFSKKVVWAFAFEVIISIVKFVPEMCIRDRQYHAWKKYTKNI